MVNLPQENSDAFNKNWLISAFIGLVIPLMEWKPSTKFQKNTVRNEYCNKSEIAWQASLELLRRSIPTKKKTCSMIKARHKLMRIFGGVFLRSALQTNKRQ